MIMMMMTTLRLETMLKTLKTTMGLEIIKVQMKMKMKIKIKIKINKALIACSKNVIALATLVPRSLTIMTSLVRAMQFKKHSILGSTLRLPSSWSTPTRTHKVSLYY